jgi:hypothetical protein
MKTKNFERIVELIKKYLLFKEYLTSVQNCSNKSLPSKTSVRIELENICNLHLFKIDKKRLLLFLNDFITENMKDIEEEIEKLI